MGLVAGIDSSTQSCKVEIRDLVDGTVLGIGRAAHPQTSPPCSEQDPRAWWEALVQAFGQIDVKVLRQVQAVAVAGQQHGFVALDGPNGDPVWPAKLWNDTESASQAAALANAMGAEVLARRIGSVPVASFTITKLLWLVENHPHLVPKIARLMLPHDYLGLQLTDAFGTDRGDASGTGWFDAGVGEYALEVLAAVPGRGDWGACLPPVLGPKDVLGVVTSAAAAATGLPEGIPVGPGSGDNMAAALGLGLEPGDLVMSLGTSGVVYAVSDTPTHDAAGAVCGFADATGRFLPLVCTLNATKVTDTVAGWLGMEREAFARAALDAPGSAGSSVRLTPYFDGERTPNLPDATGTLEGLTNSTTREDLARAAHEGVVRGLLHGVDALVAAGASVGGRLHLVGGGAKSAAYRQLLADLHGQPIRVPDAAEVVATGAAVQAAAVLGGDFGEIGQRWRLSRGTDVEPR